MVLYFSLIIFKVPVHPSTSYRQGLKKSNPEKYEEYLQKQRERCKKRRQKLKEAAMSENVSDEMKALLAHEREVAKLKQRRHRAKKEKKVPVTKQMNVILPRKNSNDTQLKTTRKTSENTENVKNYWCIMKRRQRERLYASPQAHRRYKEKEKLKRLERKN